jgi:abhydrolase domain-containing protein 6
MIRRILVSLLVLVALLIGGLVALDHFAPAKSAALALKVERQRAHLVRKTATIDGFDIAYLEGGSGEPLVLVHGFGADKDNFTQVSRLLTPHYRVIIPDMPGFGESSKPADVTYTIDEQALRLDQFLTVLGVEGAQFGGSSMGGWTVLQYAALFAQKTRSLWLLAPAGVETAQLSEVREIYAKTGKMPLIIERPEDYPALMAMVMNHPPFLPNGIRTVLAERAYGNRELLKKIMAGLHGVSTPSEQLAAQVKAPTLIVWGDHDRTLHVSGASILQRLIPGSELIVMPGIGHLPMLEAPGQTAADYLRFRAGLTGGN